MDVAALPGAVMSREIVSQEAESSAEGGEGIENGYHLFVLDSRVYAHASCGN